MEKLDDFAVRAFAEKDADRNGRVGVGGGDGDVFGLGGDLGAGGSNTFGDVIEVRGAQGEVDDGAVGGGGVGEVFEDLEVVAVPGVEHGGAVGRGAPSDFFGEAEGGDVEGEGAVPVAGFDADVVKTGDQGAHKVWGEGVAVGTKKGGLCQPAPREQ